MEFKHYGKFVFRCKYFALRYHAIITVIDDSTLYMYITTIQINFTMSISDPFEDVILILQND